MHIVEILIFLRKYQTANELHNEKQGVSETESDQVKQHFSDIKFHISRVIITYTLELLSSLTQKTHDLKVKINFNSLGLRIAICRGSAEPAFPGADKWRRPLTVRIWRAPAYGDNIGATHRDVPSNIVHSYLLTSQQSVLFPLYHPIKMKLTSVVG